MVTEELKQLREAWSTFCRWTVSLSVFFITTSLTVLAFYTDMFKLTYRINLIPKMSIIATVLFSLINIFLTWGLMGTNVFKILKPLADRQNLDDKARNGFENAVKAATPLQKSMRIFFILAFISYVVFVLSVILIKKPVIRNIRISR